MITLGLDTTGSACTAAIVNSGQILASASDIIGRGHAERLAPMVADMMNQAQITTQDITRIAVCTGPGSFTGQRVALSFAKGMALPRNIPVIGLSALEIMAATADPQARRRIAALVDVRRGQSCWAGFDKGKAITPPVTLETGAAEAAIEKFAPDDLIRDTAINGPILAWLAEHRTPQDAPAVPLYSRPPDAKLPGGVTLKPV